MLFEQNNDLEWESLIPITVQKMALMSLKAFFYEQTPTKRYQFSQHPEILLYLIGLTDAGEFYHAHMIILVTVKPDGNYNQVH